MFEENTNLVILSKEANELTDKIILEKDPNEIEKLTILFKQNQLKKNLLRAQKLSMVQELLDDEVVSRITTGPEHIKDADLIRYIDVTNQNLQNSINNYEQLPSVQIVNVDNSVNVSASGLNTDSRKIVLAKVREILGSLDTENVIDINEENGE